MDLSSAVLLGLVVMGLISLAKTLVNGPNRDRIVVGICFAIAFVSIQLIAASDFAKTNIVLKVPLNSMNFWSQMVVTVLLTGFAAAAWQGYKSVRSIGENFPPTPVEVIRTINGGPSSSSSAPPASSPAITPETVYSPPDATPPTP